MVVNIKRKSVAGLLLSAALTITACATMGGGPGITKAVDGVSLEEAIEQAAEKIAGELPDGTLLAIAAVSSEDPILSDYIMDELTGALVDRHIDIVDRRNLDKVRGELNFQMSGDVSVETAQAMGKFLGASSVVTGQLVKVGGGYRCQLAAVNVETARLESTVRLNVRLDTKRMDVLSLDEAIERSTEKLAAELPPETLLAIIAVSSEDQNLSDYIMDELTGALVDRHLDIVDRRNLDKVRGELNFQMSGDVSGETAQAMGKFLGASSVVTGQLVKVGGGYRCQLAAVNVETARLESTVRLNVRLDTVRKDVLSLDEAIERSAEKIAGELPDATLLAIAAVFSRDQNLSNYIMDELTGALVDRHINIVDRRNLDKVREELNFQMSGDVSGETAQAIGQFLGANRVVTGQFIPFGDSYRCRFSVINVETARVVSVVRLNVRDDSMVRSLMKNAAPIAAMSAFDQGINYYDQGAYDAAIGEFTEAIKRYGAYAGAYLHRGDAYYDKKDYDRAIADYTAALRIEPNYANAYFSRGDAYYSKGDYDRTIADYTAALRIEPNYASDYFLRGDAYYLKGDYDRAIADYTAALRIEPNYYSAYFSRGNAYYDKGDYDRAITDYTAALRIEPDYAYAYFLRGDAYYDKKDYDRAIADYTAALRIDPNFGRAYCNRGLAYYNKGDYDRAIADFEAALRIDPNHANAKKYLVWARDSEQKPRWEPMKPIKPKKPIDINISPVAGCNISLFLSNFGVLSSDMDSAVRLKLELLALYPYIGLNVGIFRFTAFGGGGLSQYIFDSESFYMLSYNFGGNVAVWFDGAYDADGWFIGIGGGWEDPMLRINENTLYPFVSLSCGFSWFTVYYDHNFDDNGYKLGALFRIKEWKRRR